MKAAHRWTIALWVLAAFGAAACSGNAVTAGAPLHAWAHGSAQGSACAGQTAPPASIPTAATHRSSPVKIPIAGLIDLGQVSAANMHEPPYNTLYYVCQRPAAIGGIVINDTWQDLQPSSGSQAIVTTNIDAALEEVAAYNATSSRKLGVRLRVWAGLDAPQWAKDIGTGPISVCDHNGAPRTSSFESHRVAALPTPCPAQAVRTVGPFWSNAYESAWRNVQQQLAQRYDTNPLVTEISLSSCSSLTSEPFVQPEDPYSKLNLHNAGYSDTLYRSCLVGAVAKDYAPFWHQTPVDFSFNPFREIDPKIPVTNLTVTKQAIKACRTAAGARCILLNETMGKFTPPAPGATPGIASSYFAMWNYMRRQGGAITFQTAAPPNLLLAWSGNLTGWNHAVALAARFGAGSLEIFPPEQAGVACVGQGTDAWEHGYTCFSASQLARWSAQLHE